MTDSAETIRATMDVAPLDDVVEAVRQALDAGEDDDALGELVSAVLQRAVTTPTWSDPKRGARALRHLVDLAERCGIADGDTPTRILVRAIELDPEGDDAIVEYLTSVANTDYRFANRSLLDAARTVSDPARARRLAVLDTIAEWFVLQSYLEPPTEPYVAAMHRAFDGAVALGSDEAGWLDARAWVVERIPFAASLLPEDVFRRFGTRG